MKNWINMRCSEFECEQVYAYLVGLRAVDRPPTALPTLFSPSVNAPTRPPPPVEEAVGAAVVEAESPLPTKKRVNICDTNEHTRHDTKIARSVSVVLKRKLTRALI